MNQGSQNVLSSAYHKLIRYRAKVLVAASGLSNIAYPSPLLHSSFIFILGPWAQIRVPSWRLLLLGSNKSDDEDGDLTGECSGGMPTLPEEEE